MRFWAFAVLTSASIVTAAGAQQLPATVTLDAADIRTLDNIIQTSIPPAYAGRLVEWFVAVLKRAPPPPQPVTAPKE